MKHAHLFSYNVPAENHYTGKTNFYIHILAEWNGDSFYIENRPMCYVNPVNLSFFECVSVKDWSIVKRDVEKIAESHFAELARQERINQARAVLQVEENPVLERLDEYWKDIEIEARKLNAI